MSSVAAAHELLSVAEAAKWLKDRGVTPASRHGVYVALATGELRLAAKGRRTMLIRRTELERYAHAQSVSANPVSC
jgi:hypothetical protein